MDFEGSFIARPFFSHMLPPNIGMETDEALTKNGARVVLGIHNHQEVKHSLTRLPRKTAVLKIKLSFSSRALASILLFEGQPEYS